MEESKEHGHPPSRTVLDRRRQDHGSSDAREHADGNILCRKDRDRWLIGIHKWLKDTHGHGSRRVSPTSQIGHPGSNRAKHREREKHKITAQTTIGLNTTTTITTTVVSCSGKTAELKREATTAKKAARKGSIVAKLKYHAGGTNRSSKSETKPKD